MSVANELMELGELVPYVKARTADVRRSMMIPRPLYTLLTSPYPPSPVDFRINIKFSLCRRPYRRCRNDSNCPRRFIGNFTERPYKLADNDVFLRLLNCVLGAPCLYIYNTMQN